MNIEKEIIRVTSEYFEDNLDYKKLSEASRAYKDFLTQVSAQNMDITAGRSDIAFNNGRALGTFWAALCVDDLIRTRQFIRGIDKAIKDKINEKKPLHILYAGTGPFATLALPFIFRYSKHDIKYTFLEINPFSFEILEHVISTLGLEAYDIKLVKDDATKYRIDLNDKPDIIISETMQNALENEQQVSIYLNLMNQVNYKSIFIPQKIELFLGLKKAGIPTEELQGKHFLKEKKVFEVSKEAMLPLHKSGRLAGEDVSFEMRKTIIEKEKLEGCNQLLLITEIQVYKDEIIGLNQSGLTTPKTIENISESLKNSITIDTQYIISSQPKLEYEIT